MSKLPKYIDAIPLTNFVQEHLVDTEKECLNYINSILKYGNTTMNLFLLDCYFRRMVDSGNLEKASYPAELLYYYENVFSKKTEIDEKMLMGLQKIIIDENYKYKVKAGQYRNSPAWIGKPGCTIDSARFVAIEEKQIEEYMKEFVDFYNRKDFQHPFIKGAIIHVLFSNIHPFNDGNGRISRILQEQKMTELYSNRLRISFQYPILNLSNNYRLTRGNYYQYQNDIDLKNCNTTVESWNKWFNYVLNMIDDQLYYLQNKIVSQRGTLEMMQKKFQKKQTSTRY
ncbi:MAG: Fic family protein [Bacilli bacterium]|nr:Fic family protein [Bacilli bacterium]